MRPGLFLFSLLNLADVHPDVGHPVRSAPAGPLRSVDIAEDVPLLLPATLARADDVAGVAAAVGTAALAQDAERRTRDPVPVERANGRLDEIQHLGVRHLPVLGALAFDDLQRIGGI